LKSSSDQESVMVCAMPLNVANNRIAADREAGYCNFG